MRRRIVRVTVAAFVLGGATLAWAYSTGPPASRTGAPQVASIPAEGLCTQCHTSFAPNDPNGSVRILDVPASYAPGASYTLRVRLAFTHPPEDVEPYKWGFELTAVRADSGTGAGTFTVLPSLKIRQGSSITAWKTRFYAEHGGDTSSTHTGQSGPVEWSFGWNAPTGYSGKVYFFAAGNAANGDVTPLGDRIFTTSDSSTGGGSTDVPVIPALTYRTAMAAPDPNPMTQCTNVDYTLARAGAVDVGVFDAQGRRIRTLERGWRAAGPGMVFWNGRREDGEWAPNGVYFIRLLAPGESRPLSRKVTLAH